MKEWSIWRWLHHIDSFHFIVKSIPSWYRHQKRKWSSWNQSGVLVLCDNTSSRFFYVDNHKLFIFLWMFVSYMLWFWSVLQVKYTVTSKNAREDCQISKSECGPKSANNWTLALVPRDRALLRNYGLNIFFRVQSGVADFFSASKFNLKKNRKIVIFTVNEPRLKEFGNYFWTARCR